MATLREIRKRLKTAENIKHITKAMELVSAALLRKAQAKADQSKPYVKMMKEILDHLAKVSQKVNHPFLDKREVQRTGLVIVGSDKGLCGPYNSHIFMHAERLIKKYPQNSLELILMGRKTCEHFAHGTIPIKHKIIDWGGKISFHQTQAFASMLENWYVTGELDEVWLVYTQYINVMTRKVVTEKFMPIDPSEIESAKTSHEAIFEPNIEEVTKEILSRYCFSKVLSIFNEAYASELSARLISMRAATKNAEEMISNLTLVRNKVRQAGITKEMSEIAAGAEMLN